MVALSSTIPPYGQRKGWKPQTLADYGDGGAYPEIHIAQYPLDMGRKSAAGSTSIIPLTMETDGRIKFEAVLGQSDKKVVYASARDLIERDPTDEDLARPGDDVEQETTERTRDALSKLISKKISGALPAKPAQQQEPPTYFKYTPQGAGAEKQRVIKLVEVPNDPMDPPKFKHKKVVRGPGSPPVPVVHSPPRKLTQQDYEDWKIPPCISNWKNQRGFTISLDKRLAADGRGLQKPQINDKFAQLAESLYLAERNARDMVEQRLAINERLNQMQRKEKEQSLQELANQARNLRKGNLSAEDQEREERDRLRDERRRQTEREMRLENLGKKRKRDEDRDISERIALGQAAPTITGEAAFDQRLFNQSQGLSSGFGAEDSYSVFDKPLFHGSAANQLFRPKKGDQEIYGSEADLEQLKSTQRFKPGKEFQGTDRAKPRNEPVEFEQAETAPSEYDFMEDYFNTAKNAQRPSGEPTARLASPSRRASPPAARDSPPRRRDSRSPPRRSPARSPDSRRRRSPAARSPDRYRRSPPDRRRSPPRRRDSRSPRRSPARSPDRRRRSPDRRRVDRDRSPDRRRRSPARSPDRRARRNDRSPERRRDSPSPKRRR